MQIVHIHNFFLAGATSIVGGDASVGDETLASGDVAPPGELGPMVLVCRHIATTYDRVCPPDGCMSLLTTDTKYQSTI